MFKTIDPGLPAMRALTKEEILQVSGGRMKLISAVPPPAKDDGVTWVHDIVDTVSGGGIGVTIYP
jgi:hypothetical protein